MARVFVGLSGGVDSAVSAALLKEQGHDVTGVFIKIWQPEFIECTWREDRLDAMRVCAYLGIPFREIDLSEEYKNEVVQRMVEDYREGITPNPDVLCNRSIKFGHFLSWALSEGAEKIATGHYAQIAHRNDGYELHRGADPKKDQSYFLYRLTEKDLSRTLFPVGDLTKVSVRERAKRFGLPVAEKRDSQGLCFVGDVSMPDFLSRYIELARGPVVDQNNAQIGEHQGVALYTIGQRHGFIAHSSVPHYVVGMDIASNTLRVSERRMDAARTQIGVRDTTWINAPAFPLTADVQTRYREEPVRAEIDSGSVRFSKPHIAAPGQALAVYDGDNLLGGGVVTV